MKKQKKLTSWIMLSIVTLLVAATLVFGFVPMNFKNGKYYSFFGAQSYATDLSDHMVVTYTYKTAQNAKEGDVLSACSKVENILQSKGYVSATATPLGTNKIEVTLAKPQRGDQLKDAISLLGASGIGVGGMKIKTKTGATEDALVNGKDHVKSVSIITNSGNYFVKIEFNDEGKGLFAAYEEQLSSSTSSSSTSSAQYYLYFGDEQPLGSSALKPGQHFVDGDLYLGYADHEVAEQVKLICEAGCLDVDINSANVRDINFEQNSKGEIARIVLWTLCLAVVVAFIVLVAVRHGVFAFVASLFANILAVGLALLLFAVMSWIEISAAALATIAICLATMNLLILSMFERMRKESLVGKDFKMSVDSGFQKSLWTIFVVGIVMFVSGLVCALVFSRIVKVCATIIATFGVLSVFATLACTKAVFGWLAKTMKINRATVVWEGEQK